jgi:hypothetical protein
MVMTAAVPSGQTTVTLGNVTRTAGEVVFEQYLGSRRLPFQFERLHTGKSKAPDYTIGGRSKLSPSM